MASNDPAGLSAGSGSSNPPPNGSPPKYVPQFSATTEMILKRIQAGTASSLKDIGINNLTGTPPGYENMRRSILSQMKTSENMEIPNLPPTNARRGPSGGRSNFHGSASGSVSRASATPTGTPTSAGKGKSIAAKRPKGRAGTKRKRASREEESESTEESDSDMSKLGEDSDSDDEEDNGSVSALPKMTQSGRKVNKPAQFMPAAYETPHKRRAPSKKSQEHALCKRCGRGHSPDKNMIVFCDGCDGGWHQQCHDPPVSEEAVKDEKAPWFCAECTMKREIKTAPAPIPIPEPARSVSWEGRNDGEKRAYLNSLSHPQLVSLLMQAITLHPSLPIFPSNVAYATAPQPASRETTFHAYVPRPAQTTHASSTRVISYPGQPFTTLSTAGLFARAEANPHATINFIRKIPSGSSQSPTIPTHPSFQQVSYHPPKQASTTMAPQQDDSRESTPASPPYPKAGTGLMSRLPTDEEDIDWLVDHNDFDAFSHTIFNDRGEKVEENGMVIEA